MKNKLIFLVLNLFCILSFSQTIKLDYVPKGGVIKFYFNNLICYTDSTSLFARHQSDTALWGIQKKIYSEIDNLIRKHLMNDDTVEFTRNIYPMGEDLFPSERNLDWLYWRVWDDIRILTRTNKIIIFDSYGNKVQKVQIRQKGIRKDCMINCWAGKYFINKKTKEVLFLCEEDKNRIVCVGEVSTY